MKKIIKKNIIWRTQNSDFQWKHIKKILKDESVELQDEDYLYIAFIDDDQSSEDSYWIFSVTRHTEETDDEYQKRLFKEERLKKEAEDRNYQLYLKLKEKYDK